ncbi:MULTISPECIES: ABC transporter permease [unclassified Streptomyces]|uniref:ABC transporter permease n=1 Tax=unclassified Streptomyces TaxID=2593676 RepID=UPI00131EC915|nr:MULTISPECIES: ABC transporter permease [unclassified Streptomyces]
MTAIDRDRVHLLGSFITCRRTAVLSFRALFNWLQPSQFLLAMVATPIMELVFYTYLGDHLGIEDSRFFVLGGSMLAACMPSIAGGVMALTSERYFGTLDHLLMSRRSRAYLLLARAVPYCLAGLVAAAFTLVAGMCLLWTWLAPRQIAIFLVIMIFGCLSAAFFGMALGVLGLVVRNVFMLLNMAIMGISLGAGLLVPTAVLPGWLNAASAVLPMHHASAAIRGYSDHGDRSAIWAVAGYELLVALGWSMVVIAAFHALERRMRRGNA